MDKESFESLIQRLEPFAQKNPGAYKLRIALLAALGYAYLLLIVLVLLTVVFVTLFYVRINFLIIKVLWIPLVLAGLVLRSLWITVPEPDGKELQREQAPALFDLIHEVTKALNGPKIHHVFVSGAYNAAIVPIPQLGMFGWPDNYLVLGLPLMRALRPAEFRAVLAHEVGHLSGKHGRFSGWIYRLRRSWIEVLTRVRQDRHYASFLFEPFLNWYSPYLLAYSFVLARAQERHADSYAVELWGKEVSALALVRLEVKERELEQRFWPEFLRQSREQSRVPPNPFEQMLQRLDQSTVPGNARKWFYEALEVPTGYDDTHPALADRLAAIGFQKDSPEIARLLDAALEADKETQSAATQYLHELPEDFVGRENRLLREQLFQPWNENHAKTNEAKRRLGKLAEAANERPLTVEEQWERVTLLGQVQEDKDTIPVLQTMLSQYPDHGPAHFALGAILLEQQNSEGLKHLETAMQLSPATTIQGNALLSGFYFQQGEKELAESFRKRAAEEHQKQQQQRERALNFSERDDFVPHDLTEAALRDIQEQFNKVRGLSEAYLFRKVVDGDHFYVLAFFAGYSWHEGSSAKHLQPLVTDLVNISVLPAPLVFIALDLNHIDLLPKIKAVSGSTIYKRN